MLDGNRRGLLVTGQCQAALAATTAFLDATQQVLARAVELGGSERHGDADFPLQLAVCHPPLGWMVHPLDHGEEPAIAPAFQAIRRDALVGLVSLLVQFASGEESLPGILLLGLVKEQPGILRVGLLKLVAWLCVVFALEPNERFRQCGSALGRRLRGLRLRRRGASRRALENRT